MFWDMGAIAYKSVKPGYRRGWQKFFLSRLRNLHAICALLGGFRGMPPPPPQYIFLIVQFCAFWFIFGSNFVLKKNLKFPFFIQKINTFDTR